MSDQDRTKLMANALREWLSHMINCSKCGDCGATDRLERISNAALTYAPEPVPCPECEQLRSVLKMIRRYVIRYGLPSELTELDAALAQGRPNGESESEA